MLYCITDNGTGCASATSDLTHHYDCKFPNDQKLIVGRLSNFLRSSIKESACSPYTTLLGAFQVGRHVILEQAPPRSGEKHPANRQ